MIDRSASPLLALTFAYVVAAGLAACNLAGEGSDASDCQPGTEFCTCLGGTTCSGDLACVDGYCVMPGSGTAAEETGGAATGAEPMTGTSITAGADDGSDDGSGGMEEGGPQIIDFGTNVTSITVGESVIFTATVIDVDGPDDIQGGSLKSADGAITFGAFSDHGDGTYSMGLSWEAVDQASPLEFDGPYARTFRAEFFDNSGKQAWEVTDIGFTCPGGCARDGVCPDVQNDDLNCGTCDNACEINGFDYGHCAGGSCGPRLSQCMPAGATPLSCEEVCAIQGESCSAVGCGESGITVVRYSDSECTNPVGAVIVATCSYPDEPLAFPYYRCCCEQ